MVLGSHDDPKILFMELGIPAPLCGLGWASIINEHNKGCAAVPPKPGKMSLSPRGVPGVASGLY